MLARGAGAAARNSLGTAVFVRGESKRSRDEEREEEELSAAHSQ